MAATVALAEEGFDVTLYEARPYLGGRATSYRVPSGDGSGDVLDNCQHILLRCCVNLLDFYRRLGVAALIDFHREFYFIEPGGRISRFGAGLLPAPAHFTESFLKLHFLTLREKLEVARALLALRRQANRNDLEMITMREWLDQNGQSRGTVARFWEPILVSAINEDLSGMAASHAFQVFLLGFLATSDANQMGVPSVPLGELYHVRHWSKWSNVRICLRKSVTNITNSSVQVDGNAIPADRIIVAVPGRSIRQLLPGYPAPEMDHSPISSVHLWFDRPVTDLPHATLLDRTIQWMFNKGGGSYVQLVISASRSLIDKDRAQIVELACRELSEFFPRAATARLLRSHVVKEVYATFAARPGFEQVRPASATSEPNIFVAGDWVASGWPSTMEGAVRSGYLAAQGVCASYGQQARMLLPDIA